MAGLPCSPCLASLSRPSPLARDPCKTSLTTLPTLARTMDSLLLPDLSQEDEHLLLVLCPQQIACAFCRLGHLSPHGVLPHLWFLCQACGC